MSAKPETDEAPATAPDLPSDVDLVTRASPAATAPFGELFDRHADALYRYAWSLTRDNEDARDVVQEVFLVAWRKRASIRFVADSALPWLLATCRHLSLNSNRARRRNPSVAVDPAVMADLEIAAPLQSDAGDELAAVFSAIGELSVADQKICWLCIHEGMTYAAAAARLGLTPATVGKRLERIRKKLRTSRNDYREATS